MAPFRNRDRSNRSGRGQVEHNVLEGLPINQYREVEITVGNVSTESKQLDKDAWPEPPMPRDSHLLPEHSQQILRAARSGRVYKPPAPPEEDLENGDEEHEHKVEPQGFAVKKWVKVARHLEEPEPEYLAKRRKGLPSQYAVGEVSAQPPAMRETKVKKTDAEGNVIVYKALVPEGQAVEGEVQEMDVVVEAPVVAAPGTVVEGVGVVNAEGVVVANDIMQQTPPRRRPPPPKKKRKSGPGRGKKKVVFVEGATEQGTPASGVGGDALAIPRVKPEGSVEPSESGDTPMPDAGDDDEGSGDDGSEDEEHDEGTHSPTPAGDVTPKPSSAPTSAPPVEVPKEPVAKEPTTAAPVESATSTSPKSEPQASEVTRDPSSSPELPLSSISHSRQNSVNQVPTIASLDDAEPEAAPVPASAVASAPTVELVVGPIAEPVSAPAPSTTQTPPGPAPSEPEPADEGEHDLLDSLERQLEKDSESMAAP
ncbi:hypothetical protein P280DRAFT_468266 [Massarina eburnea CBS 473.64]|uniref:Uncharacterized protein n=1 Tax=Massarina eburnea CBS 473.64 TaxID=1395130 RepID=A0A6A6S4U0_9PLEO|nr:hypothetical protein P280DRAFT_468266 [Massarina eburnea CBS 473.64]